MLPKKKTSLEEVKEKYKNSNYVEALTLINQIEEKDYSFYLLRSKIYFKINEFYLALKDLRECLYEKNNKPVPYQMSSKCYLKMFDYWNANRNLEEAKRLSSSSNENSIILKMIQNTKKENTENSQKIEGYNNYLNFMQVLYSSGIYINKVTVKWKINLKRRFFPSEDIKKKSIKSKKMQKNNIYNENSKRCIFASEEIKKNDILIRVPHNLLITLDLAKKSKIGKNFDESLQMKLSSPVHCILAVFLIMESIKNKKKKKEISNWDYYFNFLPSSLRSFPIYYNAEEMELLKKTQFYHKVLKKKEKLQKDYVLICEKYSKFKKINYSYFCYFREIVSSRIFGVTMNGKQNYIIVPFADLMNHRRFKRVECFYDDNQNAFCVKAIKDLKPDLEVCACYGRKSNARFLLNYGFTKAKNEDDEIKIVLSLNENDKNYMEKIKILGNSTNKFYLIKNCRDEESLLFFACVRLMEFEGNCKNVNPKIPINIKNELNMLKKVESIMDVQLKNYGISLHEKIQSFKKNKKKMSYNEININNIIIGEMRIFQYFKDLSIKCRFLFEKGKTAIEKVVSNKERYYQEYQEYIKEVLEHIFPENQEK